MLKEKRKRIAQQSSGVQSEADCCTWVYRDEHQQLLQIPGNSAFAATLSDANHRGNCAAGCIFSAVYFSSRTKTSTPPGVIMLLLFCRLQFYLS